jgi:16S rRNA (cytosine1402-N4)-methyltransferase
MHPTLRPSDDIVSAAAHTPVMLQEVLAALNIQADGGYADGGYSANKNYIDCTFGAGGYSRAVLEAQSGTRILAFDKDPTALARATDLQRIFGDRLICVEAPFSTLKVQAEAHNFMPVAGIMLDIGVSSMQLDEAERGFSFRFDGPLDMRMGVSGLSAADLVNEASEEHLANIFYHYGEERKARYVARKIVEVREATPLTRTLQLADLVAKVVPKNPKSGIHPATRTFQALRIAVNEELLELAKVLHAAEQLLSPSGRLVVVSFHSLEDRIVKAFLTARTGRNQGGSRFMPHESSPYENTFNIIRPFPSIASNAEIARNPRARSAKMRVAERTSAPAQAELFEVFALTKNNIVQEHSSSTHRSNFKRGVRT